MNYQLSDWLDRCVKENPKEAFIGSWIGIVIKMAIPAAAIKYLFWG